MRVKIAGTGKCLPGTDVAGKTVTNEEIVRILLAHGAIKPGTDRPWAPDELIPQKIVDLVGIRERRWVADDVNTSDLALVAAERALADAGIGWEDIGILVVGSSTPEANFPATACFVLNKAVRKEDRGGRLGRRGTPRRPRAFPPSTCWRPVQAPFTRSTLSANTSFWPKPNLPYGMAIGAEVFSRMLDLSDTNSDLWGDAAAAVVLKRTEGPSGIICSEIGTDTLKAETTYSAGKDLRFHEAPVTTNALMRGHEVQKFVLKIIAEMIVRTIERANRVPDRDGSTGSRTSTCSSAIRPTPGFSCPQRRSWASRWRNSTLTSIAGAILVRVGPSGSARGRRGGPDQSR